jgi:hypothetical protein
VKTPKIDAFFQELRRSGRAYTREYTARAIGDDAAMCEERLRDGASMLKPQYRKALKGALFVHRERRLYSRDVAYVLEYRLRDDPDRPESLENQQTSMGMIVLYRIVGALSSHR